MSFISRNVKSALLFSKLDESATQDGDLFSFLFKVAFVFAKKGLSVFIIKSSLLGEVSPEPYSEYPEILQRIKLRSIFLLIWMQLEPASIQRSTAEKQSDEKETTESTAQLTDIKNCQEGYALNVKNGVCYKLYQRGPCGENEYFGPVTKRNRNSQIYGWGACFPVEECETNEAYWPKNRKCVEVLKQGPCPEGLLLGRNGNLAECQCDNETMAAHFWKEDSSCHQHLTQGPCSIGYVFLPNGTCGCDSSMLEYSQRDGRCYQLGSLEPCDEGKVFKSFLGAPGECVCRDRTVIWPMDRKCYYPYSRGPCALGEMLGLTLTVKNKLGSRCIPNPCPVGTLYFPGGRSCHKVGTQGPCPTGQIILFQASGHTKPEDVSHQGVCRFANSQYGQSSFSPVLNSVAGTNQGHNIGSGDSNKENPPADDSLCGFINNMVPWLDKKCWRLYTQGPCKNDEWFVPDISKGHTRHGEWSLGMCVCQPGFKEIQGANGTVCTLDEPFVGKPKSCG